MAALRYPLLLVLGPSHTGKTEWAKSLFCKPLELKIGTLEHFPEKMREFDRNFHDGLVLDDVRDLKFLSDHQDKLQGKYDSRVEFASTPGGPALTRSTCTPCRQSSPSTTAQLTCSTSCCTTG